MFSFLRQNLRFLGAGFLLTLFSAFGQTWFISLFAGQIRAAHGLSDGGWGSLYSIATLAAAGLLFLRGALADTMPLGRLAPAVAIGLAASGVALAFAPSLWVLGLAIFGLRFCGQGMFPHIALTAIGRWFRARRGRAVSIVQLGHPLGEAVLPLTVLAISAAVGWQMTWVLVAGLLVLVIAPALSLLFARGRVSEGDAAGDSTAGIGGRHWTRAEVLRGWQFWALLPVILTPGFIGTVVYFHQVHISQVRGWTLPAMATGYPVYAAMAVLGMLGAGWVADRYGAARLLPVALVPMGSGIALIWWTSGIPGWVAALGLLGLTGGLSGTLWGAILPGLFGTRHLGSVRALVVTAGIVSSAIGPAVTGILIDAGIDFPRQALYMALWCAALSIAMIPIERRLSAGPLIPD